MRWYSRPEGAPYALRVSPRLESWNKADHPDQLRLKAYLDDTEALLADSKINGPWALRLDVGLPATRDLLNAADLDNYLYPLARRIGDRQLVSAWCTKQHGEHSFVRLEPAHESTPPKGRLWIAEAAASGSSISFKEQIHAVVADSAELPPGPVRLELSFVVGKQRNWLNLWKQTIDSLDPLLGRTYPHRAWHPLDGRITELGMHLTLDASVRNGVVVGIHASADWPSVSTRESLDTDEGMQANRPGVAQPSVEMNSPQNSDVGDRVSGSYEFLDDDAGYSRWITAHPDGYVINIARSHTASTARLHRASCRTINGQNPHNGPWTRQYVKVCAERLTDLEAWAASSLQKRVLPCGTCEPPTAS